MGKKAIGGTTCPQCRQYTNILKGDVLGQHRTEFYYPFSSRREHCVYGGGTLKDAIAGITPLRRKMLDRQAKEQDKLYDADPECEHDIVDGDNYSGIKCSKCPGWYCA